MRAPSPSRCDVRPAPFRAALQREWQAALRNRYLQAFALLALGCGAGAVLLGESEEAPTFFLLQTTMYFVSLFALLIGVSGAQADAEEWPVLLAQPVPRAVWVAAKFVMGLAAFATALALLFAPAVFYGEGSLGLLLDLSLTALAGAAVFLALGLWAGYTWSDRVQALTAGLVAWAVLLFGLDLCALGLAYWAPVHRRPDVWVAFLMANSPDALRVHALFSAGQIPPEMADKTPLAGWWLRHSGSWVPAVSTAWAAALLLAATRRLVRVEC